LFPNSSLVTQLSRNSVSFYEINFKYFLTRNGASEYSITKLEFGNDINFNIKKLNCKSIRNSLSLPR